MFYLTKQTDLCLIHIQNFMTIQRVGNYLIFHFLNTSISLIRPLVTQPTSMSFKWRLSYSYNTHIWVKNTQVTPWDTFLSNFKLSTHGVLENKAVNITTPGHGHMYNASIQIQILESKNVHYSRPTISP